MDYLENGYCVIKNKVTASEVANLRKNIENNYAKNNFCRDLFITNLDSKKLQNNILNLLHSEDTIKKIQNISVFMQVSFLTLI